MVLEVESREWQRYIRDFFVSSITPTRHSSHSRRCIRTSSLRHNKCTSSAHQASADPFEPEVGPQVTGGNPKVMSLNARPYKFSPPEVCQRNPQSGREQNKLCGHWVYKQSQIIKFTSDQSSRKRSHDTGSDGRAAAGRCVIGPHDLPRGRGFTSHFFLQLWFDTVD